MEFDKNNIKEAHCWIQDKGPQKAYRHKGHHHGHKKYGPADTRHKARPGRVLNQYCQNQPADCKDDGAEENPYKGKFKGMPKRLVRKKVYVIFKAYIPHGSQAVPFVK
jgi:hypothetical protein